MSKAYLKVEMIMANAMINNMFIGSSATIRTETKSGFFAKLFNGLIAARQAEANRRVIYYLQGMSDTQLVQIGMSARDVELIRDGKLPEIAS